MQDSRDWECLTHSNNWAIVNQYVQMQQAIVGTALKDKLALNMLTFYFNKL